MTFLREVISSFAKSYHGSFSTNEKNGKPKRFTIVNVISKQNILISIYISIYKFLHHVKTSWTFLNNFGQLQISWMTQRIRFKRTCIKILKIIFTVCILIFALYSTYLFRRTSTMCLFIYWEKFQVTLSTLRKTLSR